MPFLKSGNFKIYYEVHGEGEALLLLNGIMMSTPSWAAYVPKLSGKFRLILLDFRDQGRSDRMQSSYNLDTHVTDIVHLLDELNTQKANVMGLSYGGQVALQLALRAPARIRSLCLFNTPSRITRRLREIGKAWETAARVDAGASFFQFALPFIYSEPFFEDHPDFLEERQKTFQTMMTKDWFDAFIRLSMSADKYCVSPEELKTIQIPTLLVGADQDTVVSQDAMFAIHQNIPGCEFIMIPNAGHAAVVEKMNEFLTILIGFVTKQLS